jgi:triosephosphate isomerase
MRRALVAGNWKMHGSVKQVSSLLGELTDALGSGVNAADVVVCPPSVYLAQAEHLLRGTELILGAQNVYGEQSGAFTGEVSPVMLSDFLVRYVIVGHSERRQLFAETDALIARKFHAVKQAGQIPVLCVGETLEEYENGEAEAVVSRQLAAVMDAGIGALEHAVIAYEPVWAIGTGKTALPEQAQQMHAFIRSLLAQQDALLAGHVQIIYGGSVKPDNAAELFACEDIDGGLIGGASLDARAFIQICNSVS